jgi:hypothetical protein
LIVIEVTEKVKYVKTAGGASATTLHLAAVAPDGSKSSTVSNL